MKIEITIDDKIFDENGCPNETIQDQVYSAIVEVLSQRLWGAVKNKVDSEIGPRIGSRIQEIANCILPGLAEEVLDTEYKKAPAPGFPPSTTSFRKELLATIGENLIYRRTGTYAEKNVFTRTVDSVVEENMRRFKVEFANTANEQFRAEAMEYVKSLEAENKRLEKAAKSRERRAKKDTKTK